MKKTIYSRVPMAAVIAALFAVGVVGCSNNEEKSAQAGNKTSGKAKCVKAQQKQAKVQKAESKPTVHAARNDTSGMTAKKQAPRVKQTANGQPGKVNVTAKTQIDKRPTAPQSEDPQSVEDRRAETEHLIYAVIRVKMEEMIAQRADLLKQGVSASDPKIRDLEGSIMKARELLIENGEVVEEVDPPIVQRQPRR